MVRWYHAIFSAYGFWLPNDPRGSWSSFVGSWELFRFGGAATTTNERRSLAHDAHDVALRRDTKTALKYPPVRFDEPQRELIAQGFARACEESTIIVYGCAIGRDHVHAVVARSGRLIERVVGQFKGRASQELAAAGCHPLARFAEEGKAPPTCWSEGSWSVYMNDAQQLDAAIDYVSRHPMKEGMTEQRWAFVTPLSRGSLPV